MTKNKDKTALIVLSGGQDSTTCLAWAKQEFKDLLAITFDYGQVHKTELDSAKKICEIEKIPLKIQKIDLFKDLTKNALIDNSIEIEEIPNTNLFTTFVDGRNHIFLSIAAIYAKQFEIKDIITGVCETDYSNYPDCRDEFIKSLEKTLSLSMDYKFKIHTPLMWLTKKETVDLINELGKLELLKHSHTCYKGLRPACGKCPACQLRLKGFEEAGINDPLEYQND